MARRRPYPCRAAGKAIPRIEEKEGGPAVCGGCQVDPKTLDGHDRGRNTPHDHKRGNAGPQAYGYAPDFRPRPSPKRVAEMGLGRGDKADG